jgi:hypothetical protein
MRQSGQKKIAYLFGAGATHAELANLDTALIEKGHGLLIKNVSARVVERARRSASYLQELEMVSGTKGSLNIELLISLIENSKIHGWENKTRRLKQLVQRDIEAILTISRTRQFYLHNALLEFHKHREVQPREQLIGCISLNYDDVLDQAYRRFYGAPNYCLSLEQGTRESKNIPLLKLHGSFDWSGGLTIRGRTRQIEIIPLGSNKTYLHSPYGFIWNWAMEVLVECDTLRVIGCSLNQNDVHLIDLLFKANLERRKAFEIELITPQETGDEIQRNYGFFPKIKTLRELEGHLIPEPAPDNVFKTWLKYKILGIIRNQAKGTKYLKTVIR